MALLVPLLQKLWTSPPVAVQIQTATWARAGARPIVPVLSSTPNRTPCWSQPSCTEVVCGGESDPVRAGPQPRPELAPPAVTLTPLALTTALVHLFIQIVVTDKQRQSLLSHQQLLYYQIRCGGFWCLGPSVNQVLHLVSHSSQSSVTPFCSRSRN